MTSSNIKAMIQCDSYKALLPIGLIESFSAVTLAVKSISVSLPEQTYLKKAQTQFITDLKKFLD
ncbi:hypothetical protein [Clostridium sp. FS41]|uniref:hypothetical protein n=1 Tax=Clostridia TaxID=186801 RepID=UPI0005D3C858|nr:hypothetical protein [Clostridium sp. FS41]KJJ71396.1 hypothetical protein CLFS41_27840 [Clostridium sp. FS41]